MIVDGYANLVTGLNVAGRDKTAAGKYYEPVYSPADYLTMYRSSWAAGMVVDIPVGDMLREWREWDTAQNKIATLETQLGVRAAVKHALTMARVTGGAAIYIGTVLDDTSDATEQPLDVDNIRPGDIKFLTVFDRSELTVSLVDEDPFSSRYGKGVLYNVNRGSGSVYRIHWSRFVWFDGKKLSTRQERMQQGWGDSIFTDRENLIKAADEAILEIRSLMSESRIDVIRMGGFGGYFETKDSEKRLLDRLHLMQYSKSTNQLVILDKEDEYASKTLSLTGVPAMAMAVLETLAGTADIPVTRFLGRSPGGLNSTGDGDLRNYYDALASEQKGDLTAALRPLDLALARSAGVRTEPQYSWRPLWQLSDAEKAEMFKNIAEGSSKLADTMTLDPNVVADITLALLRSGPLEKAIKSAIQPETTPYAEIPTGEDGQEQEEGYNDRDRGR